MSSVVKKHNFCSWIPALFDINVFIPHILNFVLLSSESYDTHRFERISNIIKQFKLSCSKTQSQFQGMEVRNSRFTAYIDTFTGNTYIMVITTGAGSRIPTTLTQLNIAAARKHFEKFIPENTWMILICWRWFSLTSYWQTVLTNGRFFCAHINDMLLFFISVVLNLLLFLQSDTLCHSNNAESDALRKQKLENTFLKILSGLTIFQSSEVINRKLRILFWKFFPGWQFFKVVKS